MPRGIGNTGAKARSIVGSFRGPEGPLFHGEPILIHGDPILIFACTVTQFSCESIEMLRMG